MSSNKTQSCLILGLEFPPPDAPFDFNKLIADLDDEVNKFTAKGWHAEHWLIPDAGNLEVDALKSKLAERDWTAVTIGGGVRGNFKITTLLEDLVNVSVETVKPKPPTLIFPYTPDSHFERVYARFGEESK